MTTTTAREFDGPWKDALERFFEPFVQLVAPDLHAAIDWSRGATFLETELRKIVRDATTGNRHVDKLVRVHLVGGEEAWILVHVEVQATPEKGFEVRMFRYWIRLHDKYGRPVASIAVLADSDPRWRPSEHDVSAWGTACRFRFRTVKILDFEDRQDELEQSENPFAIVILAHLHALRTGTDRERLQWKLHVVRRLFLKGWSKDDVYELFRLIDWLLMIPKELEQAFEEELARVQKECRVSYVTTFERRAIARGLKQGLEQGLEQGRVRGRREVLMQILEARFGGIPPALRAHIDVTAELELLDHVARVAAVGPDLAAVERAFDRDPG